MTRAKSDLVEHIKLHNRLVCDSPLILTRAIWGIVHEDIHFEAFRTLELLFQLQLIHFYFFRKSQVKFICTNLPIFNLFNTLWCLWNRWGMNAFRYLLSSLLFNDRLQLWHFQTNMTILDPLKHIRFLEFLNGMTMQTCSSMVIKRIKFFLNG